MSVCIIPKREDAVGRVTRQQTQDSRVYELLKTISIGNLTIYRGQICVWTGVINSFNEYELDFGVGCISYGSEQVVDISIAMPLVSTEFIEDGINFMHLHDTDVSVSRPEPFQNVKRIVDFWGRNAARKRRLSYEQCITNRYCVTQQYNPNNRIANDSTQQNLHFLVSPLLSKYSEYSRKHANRKLNYTGSADFKKEQLCDHLKSALNAGRDIYTNRFLAVLELIPNSKQVAAYRADAPRLNSGQYVGEGGVLYDKNTDISRNYSIFPYRASYKLFHVYGKVGYNRTFDDTDITLKLCNEGNQNEYLTREEWKQKYEDYTFTLPPDRDCITRLVAMHGFNSGQWALIGIRVHQKCYLRSVITTDYSNALPTRFLNDMEMKPPLVLMENAYIKPESTTIKKNHCSDMHELQPAVIDEWKLHGAGDIQLVEHFTCNMCRVLDTALTDQGYNNIKHVAPEYAVFWPFGLLANNRNEVGRAYETRVDLLVFAEHKDHLQPCLILAEYKTRMELSENACSIYALEANDRLQLRLNSWMIYLCTDIMVNCAYTIQASRRQGVIVDPDVENAGDYGCIAKLSFDPASWATSDMVQLITRFAIHPFGAKQGKSVSVSRYSDQYFIVPEVSALIYALGMGTKHELLYNEDGMHDVFSKILPDCDFSHKLYRAMCREVPQDKKEVRLGLPDACFTRNVSTEVKATVHDSILENSSTISQARTLFANKWKDRGLQSYKCNESDFVSRAAYTPIPSVNKEAGPAYLAVLFDLSGNVLLYCSEDVKIKLQRPDVLQGRSLAQSAFSMVSVLNNMPLFRPSAGIVNFEHRMAFAPDLTSSDLQMQRNAMACEKLRHQLNNLIRTSAETITLALEEQLGSVINSVPANEFWKISVNSIYRKHILPANESPTIREFASLENEPYGAPPSMIQSLDLMLTQIKSGMQRRQLPRNYTDKLRKLRQVCLHRCIHRLVNTRILRASLAIVGVSDVQHSLVEDIGDWPSDRLFKWRMLELETAFEQLASNGIRENAELSPESADWWQQQSCRADGASAKSCFPHMSQRAMWSKDAFLATTIAIKSATGDQNLISMISAHVLADVAVACDNYILHSNQALDILPQANTTRINEMYNVANAASCIM